MRTLLIVALLAGPACGGSQSTEPEPPPGPGPSPGPGPTPGPAPGPTPSPDARCAGAAPGPGYVCVQDCGPPVASENDPPPGWSWLSAEQAESRRQFGCPICLPGSARIATPAGEVAVERLREGDAVWSRDCEGRRFAARVRWARSVPVASGHRWVRATLDDGRAVLASPLHPLADRRALEALRPGDALDGARVERVELVPHHGDRTWDLLPSGPTGDYWADGVLLGSTLAGPRRCGVR